MKRGWDFPPDGDPGEGASNIGNTFDGSFKGRTIPEWMDPAGEGGELTVLQLQPISPARLPENPGIVCASVTNCCGKIEGAFPESQGTRYVLKVRRKDQVSKLKELDKLIDETPISIKEHPVHNFVKFVVHCREVANLSDQDIMDLLADQGVVDIRRITKKGNGDERINTPMMILTIAGKIIPQHVYFGFIRVITRPYYPAPMQCYKCWEFGHTKIRCSKKDVCGTCSGEHINTRGVLCHLPVNCYKCKINEHPVSSRKCPYYVAENNIAKLRVDRGMTYGEAKKHYELQTSHATQRETNDTVSNQMYQNFKTMEERLNKQQEEWIAQKLEWEQRFEKQQAELEMQKKKSEHYRRLYEITKAQFEQIKEQYPIEVNQTNKSHELAASSVCNNTNKPHPEQKNEQQNKQRRSRSRSENRSRGRELRPRPNRGTRDCSTRRSCTRGQSGKRSRSKNKSLQQSTIPLHTSTANSSNGSPKTKMYKEQPNLNATDPFNTPVDLPESSEDDSTMQQ